MSRMDIPEIGKVYAADDYSWLGQDFVFSGETYTFAKIAANSLPIRKYDALALTNADIAARPASNAKVNAIASCDVPTSTSIQYALVIVDNIDGTYVNINATSTASADITNQKIGFTGSGASALPNGKLVSVDTSAGIATATYTSFSGSAYASGITGDLNKLYLLISQGMASRLRAAGIVSAFTGLYNSTYTGYSLPSGANYGITGGTNDITGELSVGDLITYNAQTRIVTAVNTASGEYTANINSGFSATATGQTLSIGKMRVPSIFE